MSGCDPRRVEAIASALRPLLAVAEAEWREQYRLARALPDQWHGAGAAEAVECLFAGLDAAEHTLARIRDAIDTLDASAQVLRAIAARLEAALATLPMDAGSPDAGSPHGAALRAAAARAEDQVAVVVDSVLDPYVPEAVPPQDVPPKTEPVPVVAPDPEPSILVDPVVPQPDSSPTPEEPRFVPDLDVEPALLHSNSARRAPPHPRAELATVGPDDGPSAPILAEAGSW